MSSEVIAAWITAGVALIVAVISALFQLAEGNKSQAISAVTVNRLNWIKDVRGIINDFVIEYLKKGKADKAKLLELTCKLQLYTRSTNEDYDDLVQTMKECSKVSSHYSDKELEKIIKFSQVMLNKVWVRVKVESEVVFFRTERRIIRLTKKHSDYQKANRH